MDLIHWERCFRNLELEDCSNEVLERFESKVRRFYTTDVDRGVPLIGLVGVIKT